RPAHTCAISLLAYSNTWSQDWRFHPSQITSKSPGSRSQNGPYKQRRKVKSHFPPYQTFTLEPSTCLVENPG
ncbi:unnamed protein product, partial [Staurois parvus]